MEPDPRLAKKVREARRLRAFPPWRTLEMGFGMMAFGRNFAEAADGAIDRSR